MDVHGQAGLRMTHHPAESRHDEVFVGVRTREFTLTYDDKFDEYPANVAIILNETG